MRWDDYIQRNYESLVKKATRIHADPHDLIHHVYLKCRHLPFPNNPDGYFYTALINEGKRGGFKKTYKIQEGVRRDIPTPEDNLEQELRKEQVFLVIDRLPWFDRMVLTLFLEGHKITEISKGSGISTGVLYQSLHKSRTILRDVFRRQRDKE